MTKDESLAAADAAILKLTEQRDDLLTELKLAERFISGFEEDKANPGINARLYFIRASIARIEASQ